MRGKKVKALRKKYQEKPGEVLYNIRGHVVQGETFRRFKKNAK